ncbi:hypothetical protein [Mucilaginibacter sp. R-33]|uniref:hypothetical protein n=1 Tax=unclassified Mucilaginibacter TaxID=2617802 RepID=UPI003CFB1B38
MKKALILFVLYSLICACKQKQKPNPDIWTKEYEQGLYNYIDSTTKGGMADERERISYIRYMVRRIKEEIPNGFNSVSKDSLQSLNIKITREYLIKQRNEGRSFEMATRYQKWSPFIEKGFRDNYVAIYQSMGPGFGDKLCDCMVGKLKKMYPDSLPLPIPKEINRKLTLECVEVIKKSKSI